MAFEIVFDREPNVAREKKIAELIYNNETEVEQEIENQDYLEPPQSISRIQIFREKEHAESLPTSTFANEPIDQEVVKPKSDVRIQVKANQEKSVKKMEEKHNKKRNKRTLEFEIGDKVSVAIPRIDRGGSDLPRLPGVIGRSANDYYEIVTEFGILNDCLRADDLELYNGPLNFDYQEVKNKIPLRKAAMLINNRNKDLKDTEISCDCGGNCKNNRCKCFKLSEKCNSHCHLKSESKKCSNN